MRKFGKAGSTLATVLAAAIVLAIVSTTGAVAGSLITSKQIKNNTIKSKDVKNETLKSIDVTDGSLGGVDVADGSLTHKDLTGAPAGIARAYVYSGTPAPTIDSPVDLTSSVYAFNSAGGTVIRTRTATGVYTVAFTGVDLNAGNIQVTAYGSDANACNVLGWGGSTVTIRCVDDAGSAVDSRFTVAFIR